MIKTVFFARLLSPIAGIAEYDENRFFLPDCQKSKGKKQALQGSNL